jgi:hypothetical protein
MKEYSGAEIHALVLAVAALQPSLFKLSNFGYDIKRQTDYALIHARRIVGCGGAITTSHWINMHATCSTQHLLNRRSPPPSFTMEAKLANKIW